jgi:hypothetical protein
MIDRRRNPLWHSGYLHNGMHPIARNRHFC